MDGERSTTKATEALCPRKKLIKILTEKYTICPLVLLQLNAYILSFHYNWNLVLMEVFGHIKTRLCLAIAFLIVLMMSIVYGIQWRDLFLRIRWQLAVGSACFRWHDLTLIT